MLQENQARKILFVRALHEADTGGVLGFDTLLQNPGELEPLRDSPEQQLGHIAKRLEERLARVFRIDVDKVLASQDRNLMALLFPVTLLVGLGSNYLGGTRVNLLLNPLMGLLLWNFGVYLLLLLARVPATRNYFHRNTSVIQNLWRHLREQQLKRMIAKMPEPSHPSTILLRGRVLFLKLWSHQCGLITARRFSAGFHGLAIGLTLGVIAGLYLRGLIQQYDFSWSSTFIQEKETMRSLLGFLFRPVLWLAYPLFPEGLPAFEDPKQGAAWIHLLALTAASYIVLPRLVLRWFSHRAAQKAAGRIRLDPNDPFFLKWTVAVKGQGLNSYLLGYGYTVAKTERDGLMTAARRFCGSRAQIHDLGSVPWGDTSDAFPINSEGESVFVIYFNGAQTPEQEVHGSWLTGIRKTAEEHALPRRILVLVDHRKLEEARKDQRHGAWASLVQSSGLAQPAWIDLSRDLGRDELLAEMAGAAWSNRK